MNDDYIFSKTNNVEQKDEITKSEENWKLLIVDDEEAIHSVMRLALDDFVFKNKGIQFLSANSAREAKKILQQNPDIALVLLDVVMEYDTAGLDLVKFIRKELNNKFVRIVLWTGQPGHAPKKDVIFSYEINDYKTKTELNQDNIFTVVLAGLRNYDTIITLENFRHSLEQKVIERTYKIETQKQKITDSIKYAQKIQNAILPSNVLIKKIIPEHFIFYEPKDIVSGDFYWINKINNNIIVAAVDCTGHGVPGAFMSMLGVALLNEIVDKKEITQPDKILEELRKYVKASLHQTGQNDESSDGMDMSLCVIDSETNKMQFAGANNSVYIIRSNNKNKEQSEFIELEPDPMPIGIFLVEYPFNNQEIQLESKDCIYLFSDGYSDQFGGKKNYKFMKAKFKELLLEISEKPMQEQKNILEKTFYDWKGSGFQVDDVLVMGIRI